MDNTARRKTTDELKADINAIRDIWLREKASRGHKLPEDLTPYIHPIQPYTGMFLLHFQDNKGRTVIVWSEYVGHGCLELIEYELKQKDPLHCGALFKLIPTVNG